MLSKGPVEVECNLSSIFFCHILVHGERDAMLPISDIPRANRMVSGTILVVHLSDR